MDGVGVCVIDGVGVLVTLKIPIRERVGVGEPVTEAFVRLGVGVIVPEARVLDVVLEGEIEIVPDRVFVGDTVVVGEGRASPYLAK